MFKKVLGNLCSLSVLFRGRHKWAARTLVIGPDQPVDGDSVACCKALINHLRKLGNEAYTLPTLSMYPQLDWILQSEDLHPDCRALASSLLTTKDLQQSYDTMLAAWRPDEIVLVDGQSDRLGFDPCGVPVFTIDHHLDHGARDDHEAYIQPAPSAGCLLIKKFGVYDPTLAVSILTDTFWLRHNMPAQAIESLYVLRQHGLTDELLTEIQRRLMVPKNPAVITALHDCDLRITNSAVFVVLANTDPDVHRCVMAELGYFFRHICLVRADGYVSLRTSDPAKSVRGLAQKWSGGGHDSSAAGHLPSMSSDILNVLYEDFVKTVS